MRRMLTKDFSFYLPQELIAQTPPKERGQDKLLVMNRKTGELSDCRFSDLPSLIPEGAIIVFNNSKVRKARIYGSPINNPAKKNEFLLIKPLDNGFTWQVMTKKTKRRRTGEVFVFENGITAEIGGHSSAGQTGFLQLHFNKKIDDSELEKIGHLPLPPYIKREDTEEDGSAYQTVYAGIYGSIAAPTAGLHFTCALLEELNKKGIETVPLTLHVGLGTFLPVRTEKVEAHKMHTESYFIPDASADAIEKAKKENRPILAVGTTSVRTLESAWKEESRTLKRGYGETDIFIYPPYNFKAADCLLTNFHTPQSSLIMLVSAFCGREEILKAYGHAVQKRYRFFSYGDAMLIL